MRSEFQYFAIEEKTLKKSLKKSIIVDFLIVNTDSKKMAYSSIEAYWRSENKNVYIKNVKNIDLVLVKKLSVQ